MNARLLIAPALCALLLAGCTTTVARRIEKYPEAFNALSDRHKALVRQGRIDEGMGRDAVWLAWGSATRVATGSIAGKTYERWSYRGYDPVIGAGMRYSGVNSWNNWNGWNGPFLGYGGFVEPYAYPDPLLNYVPYEARCVEFTSGRVSAWMAGRQGGGP